MSATCFWLIRHGETEWNADKRLQGWLDIPLSPEGIKQAEQLRNALRPPLLASSVDVIVSSDLCRASQTAQIATSHLGLPIQANPALRERCYGIYQGQDWVTLNAMLAQPDGVSFRTPHQAIEDGETLFEFDTRINAAFEGLAKRHPGQNILVFSHGGVIDIAWRRASQLSLAIQRHTPILNTSINQFSIDENGHWTMLDWGQTGHLETNALDDVM